MKKLILSILTTLAVLPVLAANKYDNPDTLFVSRDGTCEFRTIDEAIEVCRAFMDYTKVIYVKKGVYKEKLIIPSWLTHITICGEDRDQTIITWDDHANIKMPTGGLDSEAAVKGKPIGTFRTYTLKVQGSYITLENITIENNAARLGQAVALHTEGDHILVQNCRLLGNQDTVYTGVAGTRIAFYDCYIEGTTDFIFGPSIAWFENCEIHSKSNSYITAASTPAGQQYGYVFHKCRLTASPEVRAERRYKELIEKGEQPVMADVLADVNDRDYRDTHRAESPLRQAEDAVVVDNSQMTREEQMQHIYRIFNEACK